LAGITTGTANNEILLDVFEMVIGTAFNDVLAGGHGINGLKGGGGNDQIFGNGGDDYVSGGDGNDTITFGPGNDTLDFRNGEDADTITDFKAGAGSQDTITLKYYAGVTSFAQMQALGMIQQVGANTVLDFGNGDMITLLNVNAASLHVDDFVF
jgi:Ca2+-binding RTX toxin-like protein